MDLISHALDLLAEAPAERANAPALLSMMLDYIDRHSDDLDLGAATLAAKFNCSPRHVHRLFAGTGRSVGDVDGHLVLSTPRNLALLSEICLRGPTIFCTSELHSQKMSLGRIDRRRRRTGG
jgi:AraC-like DNA-binding protein